MPHGVRIGAVAGEGEAADLVRHLFERLRAAAGDDHARALAREPPCNRCTDAGPAPGDERRLPLKSHPTDDSLAAVVGGGGSPPGGVSLVAAITDTRSRGSGPELRPAAQDERRENDSSPGEDEEGLRDDGERDCVVRAIPAEVKTTTPAPAWVAAPAGPIGNAAAAAPAER